MELFSLSQSSGIALSAKSTNILFGSLTEPLTTIVYGSSPLSVSGVMTRLPLPVSLKVTVRVSDSPTAMFAEVLSIPKPAGASMEVIFKSSVPLFFNVSSTVLPLVVRPKSYVPPFAILVVPLNTFSCGPSAAT